jgi:hypothetical protein
MSSFRRPPLKIIEQRLDSPIFPQYPIGSVMHIGQVQVHFEPLQGRGVAGLGLKKPFHIPALFPAYFAAFSPGSYGYDA